MAIALSLSLVWVMRDFAALSQLHLPDTDDVVRLQQIRDWIAGQPFADLDQYRLGLTGLEMHWSRLPDLIPAAFILSLTPLLGHHGAEVAAVSLWPASLFVAALLLTGSIARRVGVSAPVAMIVAALAYPASSLFLPGRIDHHGLQLVLVLAVASGVLARADWRSGALAGFAAAAGLAIGMESAPLLALGTGLFTLRWVAFGAMERERMLGHGLALSGGLALAAMLLRTGGWGYPACDSFGAPLWRAAQVAAALPVLLALATPGLATVRTRLAAAVLIGGAGSALALWLSPACLRPYGAVDPLLARLWLRNVGEAQPLLFASWSEMLGYGGLLLVGLCASAFMWWRTRAPGWPVLLAFQLASLALALVQLRGAYTGAMLAAPALAGVIALARAHGVVRLAAAWIASAGFVYPMLGAAIAPVTSAPSAARCDAGPALDLLATLPRGRLAAPIDFGARALAATPQQVLAAPYHRNSDGNRAVYRLLLLPPDRAAAYAARIDLAYLVDCPGAYPELGDPPHGSLLARLRSGDPPGWLRPLPGPEGAMTVHAVNRR